MQLGPGAASPWLQQGQAWLGAEVPYARATALFQHFTGTTVSRATLRRTTVAAGQAIGQEEQAARATLVVDPAACPAPALLPLQLSVDGSLLAIVGEGWREARVASIGLVRPNPTAPTAPRTTDVSYVAALCDAETFQQEALGEVVHRGLDLAPHVVAVSDGAPWIQDFTDYHCPHAVRILDFAHAAGYLAQAAQATFGPGTEATSEWFTTQRHELRHGNPDQVLAALAVLPASEERDTALRYLRERRSMIDYQHYQAAGWPLGSGCVESAHKHVLQARMKGSGMRWGRVTAQAMIVLRVTLANGRWEQAWPLVAPRRRQEHQARTQQRRHQRDAAVVVPPVPVAAPPPVLATPASSPVPRRTLVRDGRPTATHPWRQPFIRRVPATATKM